ncbi:hypothetical protein GCM10027563_30440 [Parasphingorhabdus pacifica]
MGWAASFVGLHAYGQDTMAGFSFWTAWLLPATFDGAAFACTLMTYRSSINGRSALRGRVLMWGFTAVSAWINWIHQPTTEARIVAAALPVAAVAVFDVVLIELRADYEARHGRHAFRLRPGLLLLRWIVDRTGTTQAFRAQIASIPVEELAGLTTRPQPAVSAAQTEPLPTEPAVTEPEPEPTPEPVPAPEPASPAPEAPSQPLTPTATVKRGPKLPAPMVEAISRRRAEAASEGRELTAADIRQLAKLPDALVEQVLADLATNNGHALT